MTCIFYALYIDYRKNLGNLPFLKIDKEQKGATMLNESGFYFFIFGIVLAFTGLTMAIVRVVRMARKPLPIQTPLIWVAISLIGLSISGVELSRKQGYRSAIEKYNGPSRYEEPLIRYFHGEPITGTDAWWLKVSSSEADIAIPIQNLINKRMIPFTDPRKAISELYKNYSIKYNHLPQPVKVNALPEKPNIPMVPPDPNR